MKKSFFMMVILFILLFPSITEAKVSDNSKFIVKLSKCVDGDTAKFLLDDKEVTARFLAIDTPETKHPKKGIMPYGKEASNYTCNVLKKADKIELQYDRGSDKVDKYDRILVWVFVDDRLLQDELIKEGLAEVAYLYGDYEYTSLLEEHQKMAVNQKIGIWSGTTPIDYEAIFVICISIIILIIGCIFSSKYRKKTIRKIKRKATSTLKKKMDTTIKNIN